MTVSHCAGLFVKISNIIHRRLCMYIVAPLFFVAGAALLISGFRKITENY